MYALLKMAENTKALSVGKVFVLTFEDRNLQSLIISLNKDQLKMGVLADDSFMPDYSPTSVEVYGKRPGRWTLFETGELYDSLKVVSVTETSIIETGELIKGNKDFNQILDGEVMGLAGESLAILQKEALPIMREELLKEMLSI